MKKIGLAVLMAVLVMGMAVYLSACSSSSSDSGGGGTASAPTTTVALTPGTASHASVVSGSTVSFGFPANAVSTPTTVTLSAVAEGSLPVSAHFTHSAGNVYIIAFTISTSGSVTVFNVPVAISGTVASAASVTVGTTLNLAMIQNNDWVDVSTVTIGAALAFVQSLPSTALPGILAPGTYLLYKPASGSSISVSNLGIALIADDGEGYSNTAHSGNYLQVINLYDASGTPLATPTIKYLDYTSAGDMDGQALTPDGSQGILVDGGNTIRFFSNVQTGVPIASTATLDIGSYGGDGDSVAILPNGDEAVVSGDSSSELLVVSGILSGVPKEATTITIPGYRDGVVISNDGKVLLARGGSGLTVFAIASITPATGPLGGTIAHSFTQTANFTTLGSSGMEDGRNGIAVSPADSSRAVIIGAGYTPTVALVTGLTTSAQIATSITITGATAVKSVSITPDGTKAIVGTNAGIVMVSGVNTGTLSAGTLFAPTYTGASGSTTLGYVTTLGITLDGKYAVVTDTGSYSYGSSNGSLLVIEITASGFGQVKGVLNGIAVPGNDQMILH